MTRKRIAITLGAALGVMAAALVLAAVLHDGGTAEAQAPPQTYTKVSMPDFGQHSQGWCWVGAAANSFWWFAHNTTGQDGLLGGPGHPWEATDVNSQTQGSICQGGVAGASWYDANDRAQGWPPPPPAIPGYRQVMSMIAQTTFRDKVQDGVRDPDGADNISGNADDENNYCYSEGVEKWDYLIGLTDYVENYGSGLKVHDIIDPARCGLHTGLIVNRGAPTTNSRDPCAGVAGPGVPGVDQVVQVPTLTDYMTQMSAGQDVLLWMEPAPGYYPETAHVVTGVGYNANLAPNEIYISDPWTHDVTPAPHDDTWLTVAAEGLVPGGGPCGDVLDNDGDGRVNDGCPPVAPGVEVGAQCANTRDDDGDLVVNDGCPPMGAPDHNNSSSHDATPPLPARPYDTCTVLNPGNPPPSPTNFRINCGGTVWIVYDMIFVSPLVVDKQVSDVLLDDGKNYPQEGNPLTLLSEDPLTRTSNYEYATTDPNFKYLKTTNVKVSVTSLDMNLGPDVPDDAYVSFLADVPLGCEGRWIPQTSPDGLHTDILTTADTFTNPSDPMTQTGGTVLNPQDPLYNEKIDGDGNSNTIESDLHFQTADWALNEPVGGQLSLLRFFEFDCSQAGDFTFTFYNKIEPEPVDADVDPNLTNNWWKATMLVHSLHNADIEILSWTAPSQLSGEVGVPFEITADEVKHNAGPQSAWSDVTWTAQEPAGGPVSARWIKQAGDTQPSDEVLDFQVNLSAISANLRVSRNLELTCNVAGGPYTVTLINDEWPINPNPPHERWEDGDTSDNTATTNVTVNCTQPAGEADVKVLDFWADPPWVVVPQPGIWVPTSVSEVKHNNGPQDTWANVWWWVTGDFPQSPVDVRWMAQGGDICTYGFHTPPPPQPPIAGMPVDCQRGWVNPGQPNDGDINDLEFPVWLPVSSQVQLMRGIQFECKAQGVYVITLWNYEYPEDPIADPDPSNNLRSTDVTVYCGGPPQEADKHVLSVSMDISASDHDTGDPDLDIQTSTNVPITVTSRDEVLAQGPVDSQITFLANVPQNCEGRWVAQQGDTLHEYERYDPANPIEQIHGYTHRDAKVPGDGDPMYPPMRSAESALHFQTVEIPGGPVPYARNFELHCWVDGNYTFTFCNKAEVMPPYMDPNTANNWQCTDLAVNSQTCQVGIDTDGDTYRDQIEWWVSSDCLDDCPDVIGADDAWPMDVDMSRDITVTGDVFNYRNRIGQQGGTDPACPAPSPLWRQRLDLDKDCYLTVTGDVFQYRNKIGNTCTP